MCTVSSLHTKQYIYNSGGTRGDIKIGTRGGTRGGIRSGIRGGYTRCDTNF